MGRKHTVRHKTRRKLEQCANLCNVINSHLSEFAPHYLETEKDLYHTMLEIGRIVEAARQLLLQLKKVL